MLSELADSEAMAGTLSQLAHDAHEQLWVVKNAYRRVYGGELCPRCHEGTIKISIQNDRAHMKG